MFRNRSPRSAGVMTFLILMGFTIVFSMIASILFVPEPAVDSPNLYLVLAVVLILLQKWGFWLAVGASVIVYFWRRNQIKG